MKVHDPEYLIDLISRLANHGEPMSQDEMGGCVWCAGSPPGQPYGWATNSRASHSDDCPYMEARTLLKDL